MPHDCEPLWMLRQLHLNMSLPEHLINIRAIHNCKPYPHPETGAIMKETKVLFDQCIKVSGFKSFWYSELWARLQQLNHAELPCNIYFAVNPLSTPGHKKAHFAGYASFYLDLDGNKNYTKVQRWAQICYWSLMGFAPSIIIDSGNGYHVYWILTLLAPTETAEPILKRMVALSGCKEGGNTFDVSRVLRLPGFANQKDWFDGKNPHCGIVDPKEWRQIDLVPRHDLEKFKHFPPSEIQHLENYYKKAVTLSGETKGPNFEHHMQALIKAAAEAYQQSEIAGAGATINWQNAATVPPTNGNGEHAPKPVFTPHKPIVPPAEDYKWPRGNTWMKKYCKKGHAKYTPGELEGLIPHVGEDTSASNLDFFVIYTLLRDEYTYEAIREFWLRHENKLYRPEKEEKSEGYFDNTFKKAFGYAEAAFDQAQQKKDNPTQPAVQVVGGQTYYRNAKNELDVIITGELRLNAIYIDQDADMPNDREWYDVTALCANEKAHDGVSKYHLFLPNKCFNGLAAFKQYTCDLLRAPTNNNAYLQHLVSHLLKSADVPTHRFHSKVMYRDKKFIFPTFIVTPDTIEQRESNAMTKAFEKNFPFFADFNIQFTPKKELEKQIKDFWPRVLRMHLPRLVSSILGTVVSYALKPMIQEEFKKDDFHLPSINIRGAAHTAKTETVRHLLSISGISSGQNFISTNTTKFAMSRQLGMTNFIPFVIDEFKLNEDGSNSRELETIRELVRKAYSGETNLRGRQDLTLDRSTLHAPLIVLGEHALERTGNLSETSRVLSVTTDSFNTNENYENYAVLENISWKELCPHLYQFILNLDLKAVFEEFKAIKVRVVKSLSESVGPERLRIAHNLSTVVLGCKIMDRFIHSMCPDLKDSIESVCHPETTLTDGLKIALIESGQSMLYHVRDKDGKIIDTNIFTNNELFTALKEYGFMLAMNDKTARDEEASETLLFKVVHENELCINLKNFYRVYTIYRFGIRKPPPPEEKLKALLHAAYDKKEPWIVAKERFVKHKKNKSWRCWAFNLRVLREMGIWPAEAELSTALHASDAHATEKQPPPQAPDELGGQNRISHLLQ